jgi:hypothetical protein
LLEREYDHEQASGPYGPWSVPSRPRRCGPDRLTGHCPSGCGAVRVARSAGYEAGCSVAAALALARAWQRTTGSLDRLPQTRVVAEPSAQLLLRLIPLQSAPLAVSGCSAAPNRRGAVALSSSSRSVCPPTCSRVSERLPSASLVPNDALSRTVGEAMKRPQPVAEVRYAAPMVMPSCSPELATSETVARCISRFQRRSSKSVPRCIVHRLSQMTRSWTRQRCV